MSKWRKARKKPIVIEFREPRGIEVIETREGVLRAYEGVDYVIRGVEGELYPIKKKIFDKTYEIVDDQEAMRIRTGCESSDWPKIPEIEVTFKTRADGSLEAHPVWVDLGLLGRWILPGLGVMDPEILGDPELLKECMDSMRQEVQTAFRRIILKAAALILVKRGEGIFPMEGWCEAALEKIAEQKEPCPGG